MSERDLKLNSLDRYSKHSPDFALEEYGSCEVPAGCGGVVMRWVRREEQAVEVLMRVFDRDEHELFLDGAPWQSSRGRLRVGRHALGIKVSAEDATSGLLMLAIDRRRGGTLAARTAADGTWKATLSEPAPGWSALGFDDSGWIPLVARAIPHGPPGPEGGPVHAGNRRDYAYHSVAVTGAVALGLPEAHVGAVTTPKFSVWIRHELEVPLE